MPSPPTTVVAPPRPVTHPRRGQDPAWVRYTLITLAVATMGLLVVLPVVYIFAVALSKGPIAYVNNLFDADTRHSIYLTLLVAPIAVALNTLFGLSAAWAIARFQFRGRTFLTSLIDMPFAVSPVVAGLALMLIFGRQGYLGDWLRANNVQIVFALPGLVLATCFVTLPFVARELIPVMEEIGPEEELAAVSLGANAWQIFWRVTLPNIKWGLLYGIILCNARAMGEFGAVSVVSGRIAGRTNTMPLQVEKLWQDTQLAESFALASVLTLLALGTLVLKVILEAKTRAEVAEAKKLSSEEPS